MPKSVALVLLAGVAASSLPVPLHAQVGGGRRGELPNTAPVEQEMIVGPAVDLIRLTGNWDTPIGRFEFKGSRPGVSSLMTIPGRFVGSDGTEAHFEVRARTGSLTMDGLREHGAAQRFSVRLVDDNTVELRGVDGSAWRGRQTLTLLRASTPAPAFASIAGTYETNLGRLELAVEGAHLIGRVVPVNGGSQGRMTIALHNASAIGTPVPGLAGVWQSTVTGVGGFGFVRLEPLADGRSFSGTVTRIVAGRRTEESWSGRRVGVAPPATNPNPTPREEGSGHMSPTQLQASFGSLLGRYTMVDVAAFELKLEGSRLYATLAEADGSGPQHTFHIDLARSTPRKLVGALLGGGDTQAGELELTVSASANTLFGFHTKYGSAHPLYFQKVGRPGTRDQRLSRQEQAQALMGVWNTPVGRLAIGRADGTYGEITGSDGRPSSRIDITYEGFPQDWHFRPPVSGDVRSTRALYVPSEDIILIGARNGGEDELLPNGARTWVLRRYGVASPADNRGASGVPNQGGNGGTPGQNQLPGGSGDTGNGGPGTGGGAGPGGNPSTPYNPSRPGSTSADGFKRVGQFEVRLDRVSAEDGRFWHVYLTLRNASHGTLVQAQGMDVRFEDSEGVGVESGQAVRARPGYPELFGSPPPTTRPGGTLPVKFVFDKRRGADPARIIVMQNGEEAVFNLG